MEVTGSCLTAFLVGLLGGAHCVLMCGGIVGTLTAAAAGGGWLRRLPYQLGYNLGRITGYTLAGALMGGLGLAFAQAVPLQYGQRALYVLAGLLMILLGLYLADWWRGLARVERLGAGLWHHIAPLGRRWLPVTSPVRAFGLGLVWAWIPCGLVYSVLIWAIASGSPAQGASWLLCFGLGTLPNLLGIGLLAGAAARYAEQPRIRRIAGMLVMGLGLMALWSVLGA